MGNASTQMILENNDNVGTQEAFCEKSTKSVLGKSFDTMEEAYKAHNNYAARKNFGTRKYFSTRSWHTGDDNIKVAFI
uniref:Uncharacterized protein n=1 Tax=Kalanchoe fedtschenkoi TaxID=63787 RepID=A0A7N0VN09_KALFE